MKPSASEQQDFSGPCLVWCRNCCEGHMGKQLPHMENEGEGLQRQMERGMGNPTTKQSRTTQEPERAVTEPHLNPLADNGWLSRSSRKLWLKLSALHGRTLFSFRPQQAHDLNSWSLVWQRQGCLSKDRVNFCRESYPFLLSQERLLIFATVMLSNGEERVICGHPRGRNHNTQVQEPPSSRDSYCFPEANSNICYHSPEKMA